MTTTTGDLWSEPSEQKGFAPVIVQPGQSTTLYATISPTGGEADTLVRGTLYVDESSAQTQIDGGSPSANELVAVPYEYTVPAVAS